MKVLPYTTGLMALAVLSGCGSASQGELMEWMQAQRGTVQPKVQPLAEPKQFVSQAYLSEGQVSPFSQDKLLAALNREAGRTGANNALIAQEMARRKEPLEAMPLDTMAMVGVLDKGKQTVGLVRVNGLLYQVRAGGYLGQNYGRVTKISETEITLREIVQDGVGEWIERPAALQLQEGTK